MTSYAYSFVASPIGELTLASTDEGLCAVCFEGDDGRWLEKQLGKGTRDDAALRSVADQIKAYFARDLKDFEVTFDMRLATDYRRRVLTALSEVGFGDLTTYGELARITHSGPRAVGGAVGRNPLPIVIGCHRVIAGDGSLGGFGGGLDTKRFLLALEGHEAMSGGWDAAKKRR
jgi:methylated-DNA-[protein]-cysteine S-methyltransferase